MLIPWDVLHLIQKLHRRTPMHTPGRGKIIHEQVRSYYDIYKSDTNYVKLPFTSEYATFVPTIECVIVTLNNIPKMLLEECQYYYGYHVLMPPERSCCGSKYRIDPRYATIRIYGMQGVTKCLYFHGRCSECKTSYYHNFKENGDRREYRKFDGIFVLASGVGFSVDYLNEVSLHVSIGNESFEKMTEIYNSKHGLLEKGNDDQKLRSDILEENWLLFRLLSVCRDVSWERKAENCHYNVEKICLQLYPKLKQVIDDEWLSHVCDEVGCANKFIVIDGNHKLYRYSCSMPFETVVDKDSGRVVKKRCINNPVRGNQHQKKSSKCHLHSDGSNDSTKNVEPLDLRPVTRQMTRNLEEVFVSGSGCKQLENVSVYEERTAGMFYTLRPCGIRLSHIEMFTAEGLNTVFMALIDLFGDKVDREVLRGIVYDRACDLHPYLVNLCQEGNKIAEEYSALRFIVDPFHCEGHKMAKCDIKSEHCRYHPDLDIFNDVRRMNMEACESTFHVLNPFKHITRNMTYAKRLCLLKIIDHDYNKRLCRKKL